MEKSVATLDTNSRYLASPEEMEVPAERVSMRKTHEVLRLHFDLKLKQRQIDGHPIPATLRFYCEKRGKDLLNTPSRQAAARYCY